MTALPVDSTRRLAQGRYLYHERSLSPCSIKMASRWQFWRESTENRDAKTLVFGHGRIRQTHAGFIRDDAACGGRLSRKLTS